MERRRNAYYVCILGRDWVDIVIVCPLDCSMPSLRALAINSDCLAPLSPQSEGLLNMDIVY